MKKAIFFILALLVATPKSLAFEPLQKQEISVQYSTITGPQIGVALADILTIMFSLGNYTMESYNSTGMFSVQYHHTLGKRFMLGCTTGYEYLKLFLKDKDGKVYDNGIGDHFISFLPSAKIYYGNWEHIGLYGKLQAGVLFSVDRLIVENEIKDEFVTEPSFSFHIVPIGLEFGGNTLRGYIEAAYGMQGFFALGIRKSF